MAVTVELHAANLPAKAMQLREAAAGLQRRFSDRTATSVRSHLLPTLMEATPEFMPSGYSPTLEPAWRVLTIVKYVGVQPGVKVRLSAKSKTGAGRDVRAIEAGRLKHPLFGDRLKWYTTSIRPGVAKFSVKKIGPSVREDLNDELKRMKKELEA